MKPLAVVVGAGKIGCAIALHLAGCMRVELASHARMDIADEAAVRRFFKDLPPIALLVNAAGGYEAIGKVRDVAPAGFRRALEVNLAGVYACCHHALPRMSAGGHIVNLAGGGRGPMPERSGYAAAKSGLWRFTETLAAEEPELNVNAIAPGPMWSRMQHALENHPAPWAQQIRALKEGSRAVPVENTLRVLDHILAASPTGQLFYAREFSVRPQLVAAH